MSNCERSNGRLSLYKYCKTIYFSLFPVRTVRHSSFVWGKAPRWSARSNSTESWLSTGEVFFSPTHYQHALKRRPTGLRRDWWSVWDLLACWREMEREENQPRDLETRKAYVKHGTAVYPGLCAELFCVFELYYQLRCCQVMWHIVWWQANVEYWDDNFRNAFAKGWLDDEK